MSVVSSRRLATVICALGLFGCDKQPDVWRLNVFPDRADLHRFQKVGEFATLRECRDAAKQHLARLGPAATYECLVGCRFEEKYGEEICRERHR